MTLKTAIKTLIYRSGLLPAWHHWRARLTLTVAMFHRVLPRGGSRWEQAEPEYTISERVFVECLEFFRRHYTVVAFPHGRYDGATLTAARSCGFRPDVHHRPLHQ